MVEVLALLCSLLSPPVTIFSSAWRGHHLSYTAEISPNERCWLREKLGPANSSLYIYTLLFSFVSFMEQHLKSLYCHWLKYCLSFCIFSSLAICTSKYVCSRFLFKLHLITEVMLKRKTTYLANLLLIITQKRKCKT